MKRLKRAFSTCRKILAINNNSSNFYVLPMFPYPSGNLHLGHLRVYTISDVIARFNKLCGKKVLHPIGWDSFGLPAENASIENKVQPSVWTALNIKKMKTQLKDMDLDFDWDKEIATSDPSYYMWSQKLFLDLHSAGLVYRKKSQVNWDPVDQTVLANEQVDSNGRADRSGALVEKKELEQWFFKITAYADELLDDLNELDWPNKIKVLQRNWIGRSEGIEFEFQVLDQQEKIKVFVNKPELIFNLKYVILSYDHWIFEKSFVPLGLKRKIKNVATRNSVFNTKTDLHIVNPFTRKPIPIYISFNSEFNYLNSHAGFPEFIDADYQFIKQFKEFNKLKQLKLLISNLELTEKNHSFANFDDVKNYVEIETEKNKIGIKKNQVVPVPEQDLPVILPTNLILNGRGQSPLIDAQDWVKVTCPKCDKPSRRETDTMDTFVDSSWYYLRYCDPNNNLQYCDEKLNLLPVNIYVGGIEHSILHLLYARFVGKFLSKQGICKLEKGEPFKKVLAQGMVKAETFKCPDTGRYLKKEELFFFDPDNPIVMATKKPPKKSWEKMSKSKYNGVEPSEVIQKYGSDATRLFILFKAPPQEELSWETQGIVGMTRFLNRVSKAVSAFSSKEFLIDSENDIMLKDALEETVEKVKVQLSSTYTFNVVISDIIKLFNLTQKLNFGKAAYGEALISILKLLSPITPQFSNAQYKLFFLKKFQLQFNKKEIPISENEASYKKISVFDLETSLFSDRKFREISSKEKERVKSVQDYYKGYKIFKAIINGTVRGQFKVEVAKLENLNDEELKLKLIEILKGCEIGENYLKGKQVQKSFLSKKVVKGLRTFSMVTGYDLED
ncbi:hypothetical protein HK099_000942 [Clydaea vesicula]|uniref:leucine--tRNA ligase n=1 Tax=Clydaea vesicula TaxID=447962 RepID=A0AAD5U7D9_9FUNG|nr:hypothetical protein HK099_000942 [Clydaea vesicula]